MKRVGNLMPAIVSLENLHEAFLRAAKGKQTKAAVGQFRKNLNTNLLQIQQQLLTENFHFGRYNYFTIYDPKKRVICAASFPERIVFHAIMRVCHPVFDNYQIYDSYASRKGKGTYKALERAVKFAKKYEWFAKLDICKYFDSINHAVLLEQLCKLFKDKQLLQIFSIILDTYHTENGKGLPIGNLTSQYFANHYLALADHFMKEQCKVPALVRYMDDVILFDKDKNRLKNNVNEYINFVENNLALIVHCPIVNNTRYGVPFLGYTVYEYGLHLNQNSRKRFKQKMKNLAQLLNTEMITEKQYAERATCLFSFVEKAKSSGFKYEVSQIKGIYPQG